MIRVLATSTLALVAGISVGCASSPWACTPDSCGALATIELPEQIYGTWATHQQVIQIAGIYSQSEEGYMLMPEVAAIIGEGKFNGRVYSTGNELIAEWTINDVPLGRGKDARRFARIQPSDNSIVWQDLELHDLPRSLEEPYRVVSYDDGEALVYRDVQSMADRISELAETDTVWSNQVTLRRAVSENDRP